MAAGVAVASCSGQHRSDASRRHLLAGGRGVASDTKTHCAEASEAQRSKSFLSAASFQSTTQILAEAAVLSKRDPFPMKERELGSVGQDCSAA
jgi:hypothetical protein